MSTIDAFVARLPKVELHVHLVGSASVETVLELARRHPESQVPRSEEALREFYTFSDFPHFARVYKAVSDLVTEQPRKTPRSDWGLTTTRAAGLAGMVWP